MGRKNRKQSDAKPADPGTVPSPSGQTKPEPAPASAPWWIWLLVGVVILAAALIRVRMLAFPLERDEGEYAYAGQLILQGVPPYRLAYNMKLPGTYAAYAVLMAIFGQTTQGIHAGLILVNSITIVLVFLLGYRIFDAGAGLAACAVFALLSVGQGVYGLAAHATHFVALFGAAGALALWWAAKTERRGAPFVSGVLFGLAFLMKQHGIFLVGFGFSYLLWIDWRDKQRAWRSKVSRLALYAAGALTPCLVTILILDRAGVLDRCYFWTIAYARSYVGQVPLSAAWMFFKVEFSTELSQCFPLWLLAGLGLLAVWLDSGQRRAALFLSGMLVFSFLAVCPGLYFRRHYFIVMLPAVALLAGAAIASLRAATVRFGLTPGYAKAVAALALMAALGGAVGQQWRDLFVFSPTEACEEIYWGNPFVESVEVARYITEHTEPGETIFVLGSEPQIYFYSGRHSATGYIYMYALMEEHPFALGMQKELIAEVEAAKPTYLITVLNPLSWLHQRRSHDLILHWAADYRKQNFDLVGVIDSSSDGITYLWDEQAKPPTHPPTHQILVYKRRDRS